MNRLSLLSSSDLQLGAARGYALVEYILAHLAILWLGVLGHGWDLDARKTLFQSAGKPLSLLSSPDLLPGAARGHVLADYTDIHSGLCRFLCSQIYGF